MRVSQSGPEREDLPDPKMTDLCSWCLVSDVDDTLTGDKKALDELMGYTGEGSPLRLVLNSSRPRKSVAKTLAGFPGHYLPSDLITAMGTEVMLSGQPVEEWERRFAGWERQAIDEIVETLGGVAHAPEFQTAYKASFAVEGHERQQEVREAIAASGQQSEVVITGKSDVDILPLGAGKGEATIFVVETLGLDMARQVLVAGDSANDSSMFGICSRGIMVGNARNELREAVREERAYQASASHAAGVIEGLRYWGALPPARN